MRTHVKYYPRNTKSFVPLMSITSIYMGIKLSCTNLSRLLQLHQRLPATPYFSSPCLCNFSCCSCTEFLCYERCLLTSLPPFRRLFSLQIACALLHRLLYVVNNHELCTGYGLHTRQAQCLAWILHKFISHV